MALPAVLLTPLFDLVGQMADPAFYVGKTTHDFALVRMVVSLLFLNESWFLSIMMFSNVPYWSLGYEMAYYLLFAAVFFLRGRQRVVCMVALALVAGPKVLLLAPIWALGVLLYRRPYERLGETAGWALFLGSLVLLYAFESQHVTDRCSDWLKSLIGAQWHRQMTFSKFFIGDYLFGAIVYMNFAGFRRIAHRFARPVTIVERPVRWLAGYTLTLYVFHQPLLQMFAALIHGDPRAGHAYYFQVIACTLAAVGVIGAVTEHRRQGLRRWLHGALARLAATAWWRERLLPRLMPAVPR